MTKSQAIIEAQKIMKQAEKEAFEKDPNNSAGYILALLTSLNEAIVNLILEKAEAEEINREIYDLESINLFKPTLH